MRHLVVLLSLALLASTVVAEPTAPEVPDPTETATELAGTEVAVPADPLGDALDAVADVGNSVGEFFAGIGNAISDGFAAIAKGMAALGQLVVRGIEATGQAAAALGTGIAAAGAAMSTLAATALGGLARGITAAATGLGIVIPGILVAAIVGTGDLIASTFRLIGQGIQAIISGYMAAIAPLRPEAMSPAAYNAAAATGAAASAGVAGWAFWDTLRRYGALLGLAGFSRIREDELLQHPLRARIFTTIQSNPGIHASALAREVGSGWGTIVHHLQKLEKARLVAARTVNNKKCFFEQGGDVSRDDMAVASALKSDTAARLATYVANHPMTSQKDVAEAIGISAALASFHVKKLVAQGALERVRQGKAWMLTTSDGFRRVNGAPTAPPAIAASARVAA